MRPSVAVHAAQQSAPIAATNSGDRARKFPAAPPPAGPVRSSFIYLSLVPLAGSRTDTAVQASTSASPKSPRAPRTLSSTSSNPQLPSAPTQPPVYPPPQYVPPTGQYQLPGSSPILLIICVCVCVVRCVSLSAVQTMEGPEGVVSSPGQVQPKYPPQIQKPQSQSQSPQAPQGRPQADYAQFTYFAFHPSQPYHSPSKQPVLRSPPRSVATHFRQPQPQPQPNGYIPPQAFPPQPHVSTPGQVRLLHRLENHSPSSANVSCIACCGYDATCLSCAAQWMPYGAGSQAGAAPAGSWTPAPVHVPAPAPAPAPVPAPAPNMPAAAEAMGFVILAVCVCDLGAQCESHAGRIRQRRG